MRLIKQSDRPEPMDVNLNEWVEMVRDREADGSIEDGSREVVHVEEEQKMFMISMSRKKMHREVREKRHTVKMIRTMLV